MNTETMLKVWMTENVSVISMAQLFDQDVVAIENSLRQALLKVRDEGSAEKNGGPKPIDTEEIKRASKRMKPARSAKKLNGGPVLDLRDYPESLQNPLATTTRQVWDALDVPRTMKSIEAKTGIENGTLYAALSALRNKSLAHKRDGDGMWERTVQE